MKLPKNSNMNYKAKQYWKMLEPEFTKLGTLTPALVPELIKLCKNLARRDDIDDFIQETNQSLLQEDKYVDPTGQECVRYKESAYSKMSRDYDRIIFQQMKVFRKAGKDSGEKDPMEGLLC